MLRMMMSTTTNENTPLITRNHTENKYKGKSTSNPTGIVMKHDNQSSGGSSATTMLLEHMFSQTSFSI